MSQSLEYKVGQSTIIVDQFSAHLDSGRTNHVINLTRDNFYREQFMLLLGTIILSKVDCSTTQRFLQVVDMLPLEQSLLDEMKNLYLSASKRMFDKLRYK